MGETVNDLVTEAKRNKFSQLLNLSQEGQSAHAWDFVQ